MHSIIALTPYHYRLQCVHQRRPSNCINSSSKCKQQYPKKPMATQLANKAEAVSSSAEVHYGSEICKQKVGELLQEVGLPRGLLPLEGMEECGYERETGFVWMKRAKKFEYRFKTTGIVASYAPEVTALVEKGKMKKISGVKVREMMVWVGLVELSIKDPSSAMIFCKTAVGIGKNIPVKSFEEEYDKYMLP